MIPTMSLMPEGAPRPLTTLWLSLQGWVPLLVGKEEIVATMAAAMSSRWRQQEWAVDDSKRACGGRRRRRMQGQGGGNVYAWWAGGEQHDKKGGGGGGGVRQTGSGQHDEMGGGADNMRQAGSGQHNKRVVIAAAEDGGTRPCGYLPMSTLLHVSRHHARRRRGGDPLLSKPGSNRHGQQGRRKQERWQPQHCLLCHGCGGGIERSLRRRPQRRQWRR